MRAGQLRDRITIYRMQSGTDSVGQPVTEPVVHREAWADVRLLNGLETVRADAQANVVRGSARLRYCTDLVDSMLVEHDGARYRITAILPNRANGALDLALEQAK